MRKVVNKPSVSKGVTVLVNYGMFMELEGVSKVVNVGVIVTIG